MSEIKEELFIEERKREIVNYLDKVEKATVEDIIDVFNISRSTVRRDLIDLEKQNLIIRTRGGALKKKFFKYESSLDEKKEINLSKKIKVAEKAKMFVKNGDVIFISGGTTTFEFAKQLKGFEKLIVFTNALNVLTELINNLDIKIKYIGGNFRRRTLSCVGPDTLDTLKNYNFDKSFIGANGITFREGVTTPNELEARIDGEVVKRSKKSFILVDDTKFGAVAYSTICPLKDVGTIITNKPVDKKLEKQIKDLNINLEY